MLSAPKLQWPDRHRTNIINIPIHKGRKWKAKRSHQSQAILQSTWANSIRFQGLGIIVCGPGLFLSLGLHLHHHLSYLMKDNTCLKLSSFISLFTTCRILWVWHSSFILFTLYPFQFKLVVLQLYKESQEFWESPMHVMGFTHSIRLQAPPQIISGKFHLCSWLLQR